MKEIIDLNSIIGNENKLTDDAKSNLGDNYMLNIDLLKLMQSIESFSISNEVAYYFVTQIVKDFHLITLNIIRRHELVANYLIRHSLESLVLFCYSLENIKEKDYDIKRVNGEIVYFDKDILNNKAYKHIEKKYPKFSHIIEQYKEVINSCYSHSNIYSSQNNTAIINGRIKLLIFDNYIDEHIRDLFCVFNEIICITLKFFEKLEEDYKSFVFENDFKKNFIELKRRHDKNKNDYFDKTENEEPSDFSFIDGIIERVNKKYDKYDKNLF